MKTTSAVLAAAACLAVAVLPASASEKTPPLVTSSGERPPVSIELTPGKGIYENTRNGWWEARSSAEFTVKVTDKGTENLDELTAYISFPREIEVVGYTGEGWSCWDVDATAIECHNGHLVVPGEAWPTLTVSSLVRQHMNEADSIDAYVTTGNYGWAVEGVPFKTNTST